MKKLICIVFILSIFLMCSAGMTSEEYYLTTIMYHHLTTQNSSVNDCTIKVEDFENDLIYLKENNIKTVTMEDVINYVHHGVELPNKSVMLTFDDGYLSFYKYVYPLLKKYNQKAILSPIVACTKEYTENKITDVRYAHCTFSNLAEMVASGYVEVQNHTYDMHKLGKRRGTYKMDGESFEEYSKAFRGDLLYANELLAKNSGIITTTFVYPFGFMETGSRALLENMGMLSSISCKYGKTRLVKFRHETLYEISRYNRTNIYSINKYL